MNRRTAGISILATSLVLSALLVIGAITPLVSLSIFAAALVVLGLLSRGFTRGAE